MPPIFRTMGGHFTVQLSQLHTPEGHWEVPALATLGFVHTVHRVIAPLADIATELFPDIEQTHYLDESTLRDAIALDGLSPGIVRRVCQLVMLAAERTDIVLLTCSSIGPCADVARAMVSVPVLRIDEPMAQEAVALGQRIAVVATLGSTLLPTVDMVEACASRAGKQVTVESALCEGAFDAASNGRQQEHDEIVLRRLAGLIGPPDPVDVVVLSQASMARVAEQLPAGNAVPILSSPRSGIMRAGQVLQSLDGQEG